MRTPTVFPVISAPPKKNLFNYKALRCGVYWRAVLKREGGLSERKTNYSLEMSKLCNFLFENSKK